MRMNAWMLCLATCLAVATTVEAQPGGGRRGGGFGGGNSIFGVATNEAVQKELGLTTDEAAKVKDVSDEFNTAFGAAMREAGGGGGGGGFQNMSAEERAKFRDKMADAGKTTTEKFLPKLKAALTPDQFTRVQQINWQSSMARAMADPEIVKSLTISKDQQEKIKTITDEATAKMFGGGGGGGGASREEVTKERDTKIKEVLTKDQAAKFATLTGKEFDVAQLRGGGGRGGPGGGNNAGGGGGARPKRPQPKAE